MNRFLLAFVSILIVGGLARATLPVPESGFRLVDGESIVNAINQHNQMQVKTAITATAGGGQANAVQLVYGLNQVTIVGTAADSVKLPACSIGAIVYVTNDDGADAMTVYGASNRTDTINGTAGATGVSQVAGAHAFYVCVAPGQSSGAWQTIRATS